MASIPSELQALFTGDIDHDASSGEYRLSIPEAEIEDGTLDTEEAYQIAVFDRTDGSAQTQSQSYSQSETNSRTRSNAKDGSQPPISEGEVIRDVTIESLGEEGDGVATVSDGFVLIVEDVDVGDTLNVHVDTVLSNVAFGSPASQHKRQARH